MTTSSPSTGRPAAASEPRLSEQLWRENDDLAEACLRHPFVHGLGDGSLPDETYLYFLAQDALFLDGRVRAYAAAAARSPDAAAAAFLTDRVNGIFNELKLHLGACTRAGIDPWRAIPNAATGSYVDFMQACAFRDPLPEFLAGILPCLRLYHFLGLRLDETAPAERRYADWITTYASAEFGKAVAATEAELDRRGAGSPTLRARYRRAMELELAFFEASYRRSGALRPGMGSAAEPAEPHSPGLAERLWEGSIALADACLAHPLVRGLADGSLPAERYAAFIAQDAFFLEAFARAYAVGLARAPEFAALGAFRDLLNGVFAELKLHEGVAVQLGIHLASVRPLPATRAYTDFLLAGAFTGDAGELLSSMTPCMRLYAFLGRHLRDAVPPGGRYDAWIATYAADDFSALVHTLESLLECYARDTERERWLYRRAMELEHGFFEAAWSGD